MLNLAFIFLLIGLLAGLFFFTGMAGAAVGIAKLIFILFLGLFTLLLFFSLMAASRQTGK